MSTQNYKLFIDGKWQNPSTNKWIDSVNPFTNKVWSRIPRANEVDVNQACEAASKAFPQWSSLHPNQRGALLRKLADRLAQQTNIDNAVKGIISGIFAASGQTCIAGSRLVLQESIHDEFVAKLVDFAKQARIGNPMHKDTQIGPVTTPQQYEKILSYIDIAKQEGAKCVLGGKPATGKECGDSPWFIQPTIFTEVTNNMRIAQEEVFGPVLSVIKFKQVDDAIAIANDIQFGLAAGIWTQDIKKALQLPKAIKAGTIWVNTYRVVSYLVPFGGYKQSGLGRENGLNAIYDYLQVKSTFISTEESTENPFILK